MGSPQESTERIAVAAALAHLATSKDSSTSEPVKYRVKVTKEPHVDPGVAVHGGERNEQSDPGVGPVPDFKGKGRARDDCVESMDSQKVISLYRLTLGS